MDITTVIVTMQNVRTPQLDNAQTCIKSSLLFYYDQPPKKC